MSNQRQGNQYLPPEYKDPQPYGEVPLVVGEPSAGSSGPNSWQAQDNVYPIPTPHGFMIQFQLLKHLPRAGAEADARFAGFPQWRSVDYGIISPMQHLRSTGPKDAQQSNVQESGPVADMSTYFG